MTTEQAILALKEKINYYESDKRLRAAIETLVPQLRESEDERIRRELKEAFEAYDIESTWNGIPIRSIFAWLEKQKYNRMKPIYDNQDSFESALEKAWKEYNDSGSRTVDSCEDDYVECAHAKGFREGYLFGLEKQNECFLAIPSGDTAPAEEDTVPKNEQEFLENEIKAFLCNYDMEFDDDAPTYDIAEHFYRLGKKEQEKQKEQKPVQTADEKVYIRIIKSLIADFIRDKKPEYVAYYQKIYDWLDGISSEKKTGPISCNHENGTQAEWSEEDEKRIKQLIYDTEHIRAEYEKRKKELGESFNDELIKDCDEQIDWLKSLRPSWKPSEDEERLINTSISFLKDFADKGYENAVECIDWLKSKLNGNTCK